MNKKLLLSAATAVIIVVLAAPVLVQSTQAEEVTRARPGKQIKELRQEQVKIRQLALNGGRLQLQSRHVA